MEWWNKYKNEVLDNKEELAKESSWIRQMPAENHCCCRKK